MYNYIIKSIRNTRWAIRNDGGVSENSLSMARGVNPNDKTVMINPPRGVHGGGLMKTFHRLHYSNANLYSQINNSIQ